MDGGAWRATVHGVAKSWTRLSDFHLLAHLRSWGLGFQHTFSGDAADSLTDVFVWIPCQTYAETSSILVQVICLGKDPRKAVEGERAVKSDLMSWLSLWATESQSFWNSPRDLGNILWNIFPGVGEWGVYSSNEGHSDSRNPWHAPVSEGAKEAPTGYSQQEDVGGLSCLGTGSRSSHACMLSCFSHVCIVRTKVHIVKAVVFPVVSTAVRAVL